MSDAGRKDFATEAKDTFTPDSSKSTVDKVTEAVTNFADKVAAAVIPDSQKSDTQDAKDKATREKEHIEEKVEEKTDDIKAAVTSDN